MVQEACQVAEVIYYSVITECYVVDNGISHNVRLSEP